MPKPWERYQSNEMADIPPIPAELVDPSVGGIEKIPLQMPMSPVQRENMQSNSAPWEKYKNQEIDVPAQQEPVISSPERTWGQYGLDVMENVPRKALQGATFGFGEEASAGLGALASGLLRGENIGDAYNRQLAFQRAKLQEASQENPVLSPISEIGGAIGTGLGVGATKAGMAATKGVKSLGTGLANIIRGGEPTARVISGSLAAAPASALYGYGTGEGDNRTKQAVQYGAVGAGIGAAAPVVGSIVKSGVNAILPKVDEGFQEVAELAQKYKIPLSVDQVTKSRAYKNIQKVSQELPFSGSSAFRENQMLSLNRQLFKTVGIEADRFTPKTINKAFSEVGKQFDDIGKGKIFQFDDDFVRGISSIKDEAQDIAGSDAIANFNSMAQKLFKEADLQGNITGEKLNKFRSLVNSASRKTNNYDTKVLLHDLENKIIDKLTSNQEGASAALSLAKQRYKNLLALEPLAANAKGGFISPARLGDRVYRIYGREYLRGKAGEIGDLARIGSELLPELGGSDTTQKLLYTVGAGGGAFAEPTLTAAALGGNRAFQSGFMRNQSLVNYVINQAKSGGQITDEMLNSLSRTDKKALADAALKMPFSQASAILTRLPTDKGK